MANGLQQDRRDMVVASLNEICEGVDLIDKAIHDPFRGVVDPLIDSGSAVAWKALGAGGGGCVALLSGPQRQETVMAACEAAGWDVLAWDYDDDGLTINAN